MTTEQIAEELWELQAVFDEPGSLGTFTAAEAAETLLSDVSDTGGRMTPSRPRIEPGSFVRVARAAASPYAGRTGLVVGVAGDVAHVRFSAVRAYEFAARDLEPVLDSVRSA